MPTITLTVTDEALQAVASANGYKPKIMKDGQEIDNPLTISEAGTNAIVGYVKRCFVVSKNKELQDAADEAVTVKAK